MISCLRTGVHKQPTIALYFEYENELKFYNLEIWVQIVCKGYHHAYAELQIKLDKYCYM